jgi:hypothetical protein
MKINFEANIPGAREAKGKFELSDYVATSNGFDAKFN